MFLSSRTIPATPKIETKIIKNYNKPIDINLLKKLPEMLKVRKLIFKAESESLNKLINKERKSRNRISLPVLPTLNKKLSSIEKNVKTKGKPLNLNGILKTHRRCSTIEINKNIHGKKEDYETINSCLSIKSNNSIETKSSPHKSLIKNNSEKNIASSISRTEKYESKKLNLKSKSSIKNYKSNFNIIKEQGAEKSKLIEVGDIFGDKEYKKHRRTLVVYDKNNNEMFLYYDNYKEFEEKCLKKSQVTKKKRKLVKINQNTLDTDKNKIDIKNKLSLSPKSEVFHKLRLNKIFNSKKTYKKLQLDIIKNQDKFNNFFNNIKNNINSIKNPEDVFTIIK